MLKHEFIALKVGSYAKMRMFADLSICKEEEHETGIHNYPCV